MLNVFHITLRDVTVELLLINGFNIYLKLLTSELLCKAISCGNIPCPTGSMVASCLSLALQVQEIETVLIFK